jgi:hypothetical protein
VVIESQPIDGSLARWEEVTAERDDWAALLLGNGLSRNVWDGFGYASLFDKAGELTAPDRRLFEALGTRNFERVLGELASAIRMAGALAQDAKPYLDRYQSVQMALGRAVQAFMSSIRASRRARSGRSGESCSGRSTSSRPATT